MALYGSRFSLHRLNVRSGYAARPHPVTGIPDPQSAIKEIVAEFGVAGNEYTYLNPETGQVEVGADITGHFFDSEEAAEREGWTEEEHAAVIAVCDDWCRKTPQDVWKIERVHVSAPKPWPTYDEATAEEANEFAVRLRLVPETLRYERENLDRADVIQTLEKHLAELPAEEQGRADPLNEFPEGAFVVPKGEGAHVGKSPEFTDGGLLKGAVVL